jgi:hypothetical protein
MVFADGAWVIRACSILCAGTLYTDDCTPQRSAIPKGGCAVDLYHRHLFKMLMASGTNLRLTDF